MFGRFLGDHCTDVMWHNSGSPEVDVPVAIGASALLLLVWEWVHPSLLTLRFLTTARPFTGAALCCCLARIGYAGPLTLLPTFLEKIREMGSRDAGLLLWPIRAARR